VLAVPNGRTPSFLDGPMTEILHPQIKHADVRGDTLMFVFDPKKGHVPPEAIAKILAQEIRAHEMVGPPEPAGPKPYHEMVGQNVVSPDSYRYDDSGAYLWDKEKTAEVEALAMEAFKEAIAKPECREVKLVIGLSGAGKTSWIQRDNSPNTVYFDSKLTTPERRAPLIKAAFEARKDVTLVFVDTPLEVCLARNKRRTDREVPEDLMRVWAEELKANPPSAWREHASRVIIAHPKIRS
jgi:hypothetical protein